MKTRSKRQNKISKQKIKEYVVPRNLNYREKGGCMNSFFRSKLNIKKLFSVRYDIKCQCILHVLETSVSSPRTKQFGEND